MQPVQLECLWGDDVGSLPPLNSTQPSGLRNHPAWQIGHVAYARASVAALLASAEPESMSAANPLEGMRGQFPLVWDFVRLFLTSHDLFHLGQLSAWRQAMGHPGVLG